MINFRKGTEKSLRPASTINFIYGQPGAGKSTLALTASKIRKMLFIDLDNTYDRSLQAMNDLGMGDLINEDNISVWEGPSYKEIKGFLNSEQVYEFEYIALDSFSFLADRAYREELLVAEAEAAKHNKQVNGMQVYGRVGDIQKDLINIVNERSITIDFICHEKEVLDEEVGYKLVSPATVGQAVNPVLKRVADNIMYIRKVAGEDGVERELVIESDETILTKKKDSKLPAIVRGGNMNYSYLSQFFPNNGLSTAEADAEKLKTEKEQSDKIESLKEELNSCDDIDLLRERYKEIIEEHGSVVGVALKNSAVSKSKELKDLSNKNK